MGLGIGMMMQNLVLATQNQVAPADLGSASSVVTFFRSLGGAVGVSALGAVLGNRVTHYVKDGLAELGPKGAGRSATAAPAAAASPTWTRSRRRSARSWRAPTGTASPTSSCTPRPRAARLPPDPVHQGGRAEDAAAGQTTSAPGRGDPPRPAAAVAAVRGASAALPVAAGTGRRPTSAGHLLAQPLPAPSR